MNGDSLHGLVKALGSMSIILLLAGFLGGCGKDDKPTEVSPPNGRMQFKYFVDATAQACAVCRSPNCGPDGCDPGCLVAVLLEERTRGLRDSLFFEAYVGGDGHTGGYSRESIRGIWMDFSLVTSASHNTYDVSLSRVPKGLYRLDIRLEVSWWDSRVLADAIVDSITVGTGVTSVGTISAFGP